MIRHEFSTEAESIIDKIFYSNAKNFFLTKNLMVAEMEEVQK